MKKRIVLCCVLLALWIGALPVSAVVEPGDIDAEAAILVDADTGQVLFEKNGYSRMYPASITKIMTGMLAMEHLDRDDIVIASSEALRTSYDSTTANIQAGERLTVDQVMYAMMLPSANEAANILAEATSGSIDAFVELMNQRAYELGAQGTRFSNTHGLPSDTHYTTAFDMALITRQAIQTPGFMGYFGASSYSMPATNKYGARHFTNTHPMLVPGSSSYDSRVIGGKTGYTGQAGYTLVTVAQDAGRTLITVVLNSDREFYDTRTLLDYGFDEFYPYTFSLSGIDPVEIAILDGEREVGKAKLTLPDELTVLLHESAEPSDVVTDLRFPSSIGANETLLASVLLELEFTSAESLPTRLLSIPFDADITYYELPGGETESGLPYLFDIDPVSKLLILLSPVVLLLVILLIVFILYRRHKRAAEHPKLYLRCGSRKVLLLERSKKYSA